MKIIGITGNIGSGKSRVASHICTLNELTDQMCKVKAQQVDADDLARKIININQGKLSDFGDEIVKDGAVDWCQLFNEVFNPPNEKLQRIRSFNRWIHELVANKIMSMIEIAKKNGNKYFFFSAPLLFEARIPTDFLILVTCDDCIRRQRVAFRSLQRGIPVERTEILASIQFPQSIMRYYCDYEIDNTGNFEKDTIPQIINVINEIVGDNNE